MIGSIVIIDIEDEKVGGIEDNNQWVTDSGGICPASPTHMFTFPSPLMVTVVIEQWAIEKRSHTATGSCNAL